MGALFAGLMFVGGEKILGLYTSSPEVVEAGMIRLKIITSAYFIAGMMDVVVGALRGLGYAVVPMIVSLVGVCGIRLLWIWTVFPMKAFHTPEMIYITYPLTWAITLATHLICFIVIRKKLAKKWGC